MGLAVLPARLKEEIALLKDAILGGKDIASIEAIEKHTAWFNAFKDKYTFTAENTEDILKAEIREKEWEIASVRGSVSCPACGQSNSLEHAYCSNCGKPL